MRDLLIIEEVDVRRVDDPNDTRVLTINKLVLPPLKQKTVEHTPGGGVGTVNHVLPILEALEPAFAVKGIDLGTLAVFGIIPGTMDKWTFAGALRDLETNKIIPMRATIQGVIAEHTIGEHTPGEVSDCDHVMHEVKYYDLFIDGVEKFCWDYRGRIWRTNGVDIFAPRRAALGA